jgi:hypothetical protein
MTLFVETSAKRRGTGAFKATLEAGINTNGVDCGMIGRMFITRSGFEFTIAGSCTTWFARPSSLKNESQ